MNSSDQLELQGNCSECRKKKYCSKNCKARDAYMSGKLAEAFSKTSAGKMFKALNDAMGSTNGKF